MQVKGKKSGEGVGKCGLVQIKSERKRNRILGALLDRIRIVKLCMHKQYLIVMSGCWRDTVLSLNVFAVNSAADTRTQLQQPVLINT